MAGVISVIIPTLNAAQHLPRTLAPLVDGMAEGLIKEVIIADGGSRDETLEIADAAGCSLISGEPVRATLLRLAAARAKGKWLLFLRQDTSLSHGWTDAVQAFLSAPEARKHAAAFRLAYNDRAAPVTLFWLRLWRQVLKQPGGEQGMLVSRFLYDAIGGYPEAEEPADIHFARRIGAKRLVFLQADAVTSRGSTDELSPATAVRPPKDSQRSATRVSSGV